MSTYGFAQEVKKAKVGTRGVAIFHKSPIDQSPGFQFSVHGERKKKRHLEGKKHAWFQIVLPHLHLIFPAPPQHTASPTDYDRQQKSLPFLPLPVKIIHEFPRRSWIENLVFRPNGLILANLLSAPEIYQVDPTTGAASVATKIPTATGLIGIAEIEKDVYYNVIAGNYNVATLTAKPGMFSVWRDVDTSEPNKALAKMERW